MSSPRQNGDSSPAAVSRDAARAVAMPDPDGGSGTISLRDIFVVLRRHARLVVVSVVVCVALTAFHVLRQPPRYRAMALVQLTEARRSITSAIEYQDAQSRGADAPLSQIQVGRSRGIIGVVVDSAGIRLRPDTRGFPHALLTDVLIDPDVALDSFVVTFTQDSAAIRNGTRTTTLAYGKPYRSTGVSFTIAANPGIPAARFTLLPREQTIDWLLASLRAAPRGETNIVEVSFEHESPVVAQRVTNTLVKTFQDANIRAAQGQSRRRRLFLEVQLREIDSQLVSAQKALDEFRTREQVFASREKIAAQQTALMTLDMRREELAADRRMYSALLERIQSLASEAKSEQIRALITVPELSTNPVFNGLYQQLSQYQVARDSLTTGEWRSAATNPDVARLDQLIAGTQQRLVAAMDGHIGALDARLSALGTLRARSAAAVGALPRTESREEALVRQVDANLTLANRLREEYEKARMAEVVEAGQVDIVDLAALPYAPVGDMQALKLLLGLAIGLVLGGGGAITLEGTNSRVRRRTDLEKHLGVPVLSIIPKIVATSEKKGRFSTTTRAPSRTADGRGRSSTVPMSPAGGEAFRLLRTSLKWSAAGASSQTLLVTSAMAQEGKTTTSTNLAAAFALEGQQVLIIDCDLRRTRLHRAFRVPRNPGLAQVLRGLLTPAEAIRSTFISGLSFLPAGSDAEGTTDLFGSDKMRAVLEELSHVFNIIVLDTPPVLAVADAVTLAPLADGVLLVVRAGATDWRAVRQTLQQLSGVGAGIVGTVLNDSRGEVRRYEEYYYNEDYAAVASE